MAIDTTYQGNKGQDNDGLGIYLPKGVEQNSYAANKYSAIDKEIKGGLHYVKYFEDLTDNSYAGIHSAKQRVGMLAYCHYEYNSGSPSLHEKLYILRDTPATDINNWEELATGSTVSLNKVEVINLYNQLPTSNVSEGDIYNIIDARQTTEIKEIISDSGQTFMRVSDYYTPPPGPTSALEWKNTHWKDLVTGNEIFFSVAGTSVNPLNPSTTYQVGNYNTSYTPQIGQFAIVFELLDDQGSSIDSSGWDNYDTNNSTVTCKLKTAYSSTKIANIITQTPLTVEWLDVITNINIDPTEVALNSGARHTHANKTLLDSIKNTGSGNEFLADDGTYKSPNSNGLTPSNIGDTLDWDGSKFNLPLSEKTMAEPELNIDWDVTKNDGVTAYSLVSPYTTSSRNIIVESGCKVNLNSAQFKYQLASNEVAPDEISGDWGDFNSSGTAVPNDNTFTDAQTGEPLDLPINDITTDTSYDITFTKLNVRRLKVNPSTWNVYLDTNNEIETNSMSVVFGKTVYFGYNQNTSISQLSDLVSEESKLLNNDTSGTVKITNVATNSNTKNYAYFVIPDSFGDVNNYAEKFSGQSEATLAVSNTPNTFTNEDLVRLSDITDTSPSGVTETYRVYRTRQDNNYVIQTEYLKINI